MNGRRSVIGLCMLFALFVSAFAAQSASAVNGTTAFTCASTASGAGFSKEHCKPSDAVGSGAAFKHVEIPQDTTTEITGSNETTAGATDVTKLKATINGISTEIQAKVTTGSGWMENKKEGAGDPNPGEHFAIGHGTITYTAAEVTAPAGKGCTVSTDIDPLNMGEPGVVHTEPLKATTTGQGDALKFEPTTGSIFTRFYITGCAGSEALVALNGTYTVTGSVIGTPDGATTNFTHTKTTEQNTLKLNGSIKSGLEGTLTIKGRANSSEAYKPISSTTVSTP
jgi:hypothetical protein